MGWCKDPDRGLPAPDKILFLDMSVEDAKKVLVQQHLSIHVQSSLYSMLVPRQRDACVGIRDRGVLHSLQRWFFLTKSSISHVPADDFLTFRNNDVPDGISDWYVMITSACTKRKQARRLSCGIVEKDARVVSYTCDEKCTGKRKAGTQYLVAA